MTPATEASMSDRFIGCLLGGAVGDALGAPVEFMKLSEIRSRFGPSGITEFSEAYGLVGAITDDTQMTLFTAEGLLRAWVRGAHRGITTYSGVTAHAYLRWLQTQGETSACDLSWSRDSSGWLISHRELHQRRGPGNTCLSALRAMKSFGDSADNQSKGCGGVMRTAPVGLFAARAPNAPDSSCFDLACEVAALTHGHPTGQLSAGVMAVLVMHLVKGATLPAAVIAAKQCLLQHPAHEETLRAIEQAESLASSAVATDDAIATLGQGWIAEEALAISLYCALSCDSFRQGIERAVNHTGDSDSTGAITGQLLGAQTGPHAIPASWLSSLELRAVIEELALDLYQFPDWDIGDYAKDREFDRKIWNKYPGN